MQTRQICDSLGASRVVAELEKKFEIEILNTDPNAHKSYLKLKGKLEPDHSVSIVRSPEQVTTVIFYF